jgi:hypothetical protein
VLHRRAAHLLAALRLWAQSQYRSDQAVRDILQAADVVALRTVARELMSDADEAMMASWIVEATTRMPAEQLQAIASYALRAL